MIKLLPQTEPLLSGPFTKVYRALVYIDTEISDTLWWAGNCSRGAWVDGVAQLVERRTGDLSKDPWFEPRQDYYYLYYYYDCYYLLKAFRPVDRTGSPRGFSLYQILHKLNTMQNMHILQTQNRYRSMA